jgi:hypothetical protein
MTDRDLLSKQGFTTEGIDLILANKTDPAVKGSLEELRGQPRAFKGVWIPYQIWLDDTITWTEKCLLAEIDSLDDGRGCRASAGHLARMMGSTAGSIRTMLSKLAARKYVSTDVSEGGLRKLKVTPWLVGVSMPVNGGCQHPLTRVSMPVNTEVLEDTSREVPPLSPIGGGEGFEEFWNAYPRKVGKGIAVRIWLKQKLDDLLPRILDAISEQKRCEQWTKDGGRYIPHPSTWLNQSRWEDEVQANGHQPKKFLTHFERTIKQAMQKANLP